MDAGLKQAVLNVKQMYAPEGFIILGVFGSQARGNTTNKSDLDILYRVGAETTKKYPGWDFFTLYERVRKDLEDRTGMKVDLVDADALTKTGQKFILPTVEYV